MRFLLFPLLLLFVACQSNSSKTPEKPTNPAENTSSDSPPSSMEQVFRSYLDSARWVQNLTKDGNYMWTTREVRDNPYLPYTSGDEFEMADSAAILTGFMHYGLRCELYQANLDEDAAMEYLGLVRLYYPPGASMNLIFFDTDQSFLGMLETYALDHLEMEFAEIRKPGLKELKVRWRQRSKAYLNRGWELIGLEKGKPGILLDMTSVFLDWQDFDARYKLGEEEAFREKETVAEVIEDEKYAYRTITTKVMEAVVHFPLSDNDTTAISDYPVRRALGNSQKRYVWDDSAGYYVSKSGF
ncbi:MAG: hypothetical protein AAF570_01890 [Bacteroidota bacterium]